MRRAVLRATLVIVGLLLPVIAFAQDVKLQAQAAATQWDQRFNKKDAATLAQSYAPRSCCPQVARLQTGKPRSKSSSLT